MINQNPPRCAIRFPPRVPGVESCFLQGSMHVVAGPGRPTFYPFSVATKAAEYARSPVLSHIQSNSNPYGWNRP